VSWNLFFLNKDISWKDFKILLSAAYSKSIHANDPKM